MLAAWRLHSSTAALVGCIIVEKPLTKAQLHRLPRYVREVLIYREAA
jgi:hypothetical protein